jgi:hypothetical protein
MLPGREYRKADKHALKLIEQYKVSPCFADTFSHCYVSPVTKVREAEIPNIQNTNEVAHYHTEFAASTRLVCEEVITLFKMRRLKVFWFFF